MGFLGPFGGLWEHIFDPLMIFMSFGTMLDPFRNSFWNLLGLPRNIFCTLFGPFETILSSF